MLRAHAFDGQHVRPFEIQNVSERLIAGILQRLNEPRGESAQLTKPHVGGDVLGRLERCKQRSFTSPVEPFPAGE